MGLSRDHALLRWRRRRWALLRGPAAGAGVHALLKTRLGRWHRDVRHPAWGRARCCDGRPGRFRRVASIVRSRRIAGAARAAGPHLGTGVTALALPPGPLRGGTQVAGLGTADGAVRPADADR